jgi:hypothetical protein
MRLQRAGASPAYVKFVGTGGVDGLDCSAGMDGLCSGGKWRQRSVAGQFRSRHLIRWSRIPGPQSSRAIVQCSDGSEGHLRGKFRG